MYKEEISENMQNFAFGYCRKSEEDKKRQVLSLNDQEEECKKLIGNYGLILTHPFFKEEKSAKVAGKRVEFYRMLNLIKLGKAHVIVCWTANRLARNIMDGAEIISLVQNKGLRIITPYTQYDSTNWFMLLIEFGMSTDFSLKLSKDVKRGLDSKVAKGIRPGKAPLGYLNVGAIKGEKEIAVDPIRFDLCRKWWDLMQSGEYTVEQSLAKITKLGLRHRDGKKISRTNAFKFFHNIFYTGWFSYLGEIKKGNQAPMITLEEFNKVQKIITGKFGGKYENVSPRRPMPLSGFIKCGECGATITADRRTKHYKNGTSQEFAWYRCKKNKGNCKQKAYLPADKLEGQVKDYIDHLELDSRFIEWVRKVLKRRNHDEFEFDTKQKEVASKRIIALNEKKELVYGMKLDGLYTDIQYKSKIAEVQKEEAEINEQMHSDRISYWESIIDKTLDFSKRVMELFNTGDDYTKRMVLQILGSDLFLKDKKLYFEPKSVFIFLKDNQKDIYKQYDVVGLKKMPNVGQYGDLLPLSIPLGACL